MNILLVSPYHGGSHAAWAEGYQAHSGHRVGLLTLPARFWKWRMHGAALTLARRFFRERAGAGHSRTGGSGAGGAGPGGAGAGGSRPSGVAAPTREDSSPDCILATDMLDLTTFLAMTRAHTGSVPAVLFMHENQLTYPLPEEPGIGAMRRQLGERDQHYAFINLASMAAADRVLFNSRFHLESWFTALPPFLKHFPEHNELAIVELLREKSEVVGVGIDTAALDVGRQAGKAGTASASPAGPQARDRSRRQEGGRTQGGEAPLVLWNQRWEYDKNPGAFFAALDALAQEGIEFRVALCGERFGQQPEEFGRGIDRLGERVVHVGLAERDEYIRLLWEAAATVSTARHEFFGISVLEAIYCETFPVLPGRLSYPELLPEGAHARCLYDDSGKPPAGLLEHLRWALLNSGEARRFAADELVPHVARYAWSRLAPIYDRSLAAAGRFRNGPRA